jgi:hypothetical protein
MFRKTALTALGARANFFFASLPNWLYTKGLLNLRSSSFSTTLTGQFNGEGGGRSNRFQAENSVDPKNHLLTVCPLHGILRFVPFSSPGRA